MHIYPRNAHACGIIARAIYKRYETRNPIGMEEEREFLSVVRSSRLSGPVRARAKREDEHGGMRNDGEKGEGGGDAADIAVDIP